MARPREEEELETVLPPEGEALTPVEEVVPAEPFLCPTLTSLEDRRLGVGSVGLPAPGGWSYSHDRCHDSASMRCRATTSRCRRKDSTDSDASCRTYHPKWRPFSKCLNYIHLSSSRAHPCDVSTLNLTSSTLT